MAGDITRSTFQHSKHYSGVRMQQGRVQMDADWNEQVDIRIYTDRTTNTDVIGQCGVPQDDPGFAVSVVNQNLLIAPGRLYVDGILCENDAPAGVLIALPPAPGAAPEQPDLPGVNETATGLAFEPLLVTLGGGANFALPTQPGIYAAYLDVWERDIAALEDPSIREIALGGPDHATRTKVVWQVKLLYVGGLGTQQICPTNWNALLSNAQLMAQAKPDPGNNDPCAVPAQAGYRRLENQLYRVEIHQGGAAGTATFKWSRDNGSVVAAWTGMDPADPNGIVVSTLGKDQERGFAAGQWVELTDDTRELWGIPGAFFQIQKAQIQANGPTLTLNTAPVMTNFPLNPKVRRWDATTAGAAVVQEGMWLDLEDGVQVFFTAGGNYHTGDFWLIPARTATAISGPQVEWPTDNASPPNPIAQRPAGVQHHNCSLALLQFNSGWTFLKSCLTIFPPLTGLSESCCTVVVNVGDDIQNAIDSLPDEGGCVCLKTGIHAISKAIVIKEKRNISLHGESIGAVVRNLTGGAALAIGGPESGVTTDITVEHISFVTTPPSEGSAFLVTITQSERVTIRECKVSITTPVHQPSRTAAFRVSNAKQIQIQNNQVSGVPMGILAQGVDGLTVGENQFAGPAQQSPVGGTISVGEAGIELLDPAGIVCVSENRISDYSQGVVARASGRAVAGTQSPLNLSIEGNLVLRQRLSAGPLGRIGWDGQLGQLMRVKAFGIVTDLAGATIADNTVELTDHGHGGIITAASGVEVRENSIPSTLPDSPSQPPFASVGPQGALTGTYTFEVTFVSATGESQPGPPSSSISVDGQNISLTNIQISQDPNVVARRIYGFRNVTSSTYQLIGTISDNTTTTFTVTTDQPQWTTSPPSYDWLSLPIGIVAYKPKATPSVEACRINANSLSGPQKGIAVLAEFGDAIDLPEIAENRIANGVSPEPIDLTQPETTFQSLESSLEVLGSAFGILMIRSGHAAVVRNAVSRCTVGIADLTIESKEGGTGGGNFSKNFVSGCALGILLVGGGFSAVTDGMMNDNQVAIGLFGGNSNSVRGNRCDSLDALVHFLDLNSSGARFDENITQGGQTGLLAFSSSVRVDRNTFTFAKCSGIVAASCSEVRIEGNDLQSCGQTAISAIEANMVPVVNGWAFGKKAASAITVVNCAGLVTIEDCEVIETFQVADARRGDICVLGGSTARVRDCRVVRTQDGPGLSRAVLVLLASNPPASLATVDASGNHIDVTTSSEGTNFMVVDIVAPATKIASDITFAGNTIVQRGTLNLKNFAVTLQADCLAVTGNRIHSETQLPPLDIIYTAGLSYVGNVVSRPAQIQPATGNEHPAPPQDFNVLAG